MSQARHIAAPGATEALAKTVTNGRFEHLPQAAVSAIKASILDGLGVAMAGAVEPVGRTIVDFVRELGGSPQAAVLGSAVRTSPPEAALANGAMIHALDFDDSLQIFSFHFTSFLLPAVLALGERKGISGRDAITAFAYGLEASVAVFRAATSRRDYDLGWHRTATVGTLGAAAAGAKVLGLDVEGTRACIGIAASQAAGIRQNFGTMTKPLHSGLTARNGVTAAMLAHRGWTADPDVLEGKLGFCKVFFGDGHYDLANLHASLARPFHYVSSIRIKKFPACGQAARPIEAMLALVKENDIRPQDVERIECGLNPSVLNILVHSDPATGLEGKFSAEFCLAVALLDRKVVLSDFTDDRVRQPAVQALMRKVTRYADPEVPHHGGKGPTVTVLTRDGRRLSRRIDMDEDQPWPAPGREERIEKYRDCAQRVLSADRIERVLEFTENLEEVSDVRELVTALSIAKQP
jgi:2-methylcitrate dehydratase PrpD